MCYRAVHANVDETQATPISVDDLELQKVVTHVYAIRPSLIRDVWIAKAIDYIDHESGKLYIQLELSLTDVHEQGRAADNVYNPDYVALIESKDMSLLYRAIGNTRGECGVAGLWGHKLRIIVHPEGSRSVPPIRPAR